MMLCENKLVFSHAVSLPICLTHLAGGDDKEKDEGLPTSEFLEKMSNSSRVYRR